MVSRSDLHVWATDEPRPDDACRCGAITWTGRTLRRAGGEMTQPPARRSRKSILIIVARNAADHYRYLKQSFAGDEHVEVVLDRRRAERRRGSAGQTPERRRADRRSRLDVTERLQSAGWSIVRLDRR